jgi:hypothetical protein
MTICIAAVAGGGSSIVCVADKMLSFGDFYQWDSHVTKIVAIGSSGAVGLIAGSVPHCRAVINELASRKNLCDHIAAASELEDGYAKNL